MPYQKLLTHWRNIGLEPVWWFYLAMAIWISFMSLGSMPLMDADEGAFTEATREMFERRDFLATYLNGQPRHDKPILFYWLQAASIAVFGLNEFAARLPSVLSGLVWAGAIIWFCRQLGYSMKTALIAGLLLLSSLHLVVIIKVATADALLNALLALSMFHLIVFLRRNTRANLRYASLFMALGFLTKGPIALLVPGGFLLIHCLMERNVQMLPRIVADGWSGLIFAAIALPWYIVVTLRDKGEFLKGFFLHHNIHRFNETMEHHSGPIYYYLPVAILALLPYSVLFVPLTRRARQLWQEPLTRQLLIWFLLVLVIFSVSSTKLPHYLIYGYSGLIVLLANELERCRYQRWLFVPALLLSLVFLAFPWVLDLLIPMIKDPYLHDLLEEGKKSFTARYAILCGLLLLIQIFFLFGKPTHLSEKMVATGLGIGLIVSAHIMPSVVTAFQAPVVAAARIIANRPENVVTWRYTMPSFSVYRGRVTVAKFPDSGEIVLTKAKYADQLPPYTTLYRSHGALLAKIE